MTNLYCSICGRPFGELLGVGPNYGTATTHEDPATSERCDGSLKALVKTPPSRRRYLLEVTPDERQGRARWWGPSAGGYTNDIAFAGLYTKAEAEERAFGGHTSLVVPVADVAFEIEALLKTLRDRERRLRVLLGAV